MYNSKEINSKPNERGFELKRTSSGTTEVSRGTGNRMDVELVRTWLSQAPQLNGEPLNWNYLPSYAGWSLSVPKAETCTDILGNVRSRYELKITRRISVQSNAERLSVMSTLEDLADWARSHPLPGSRLRVADLPQFSSRSSAGTEDISITLILQEE